MQQQKKLLILIEWFTPGYKAGGPIQSCLNIVRALNNHYAIYVLTTDTDHGELMPYPGITSNEWVVDKEIGGTIFYLKKKTISCKQVAKEIENIAPDFIYLNLLFSPYFVLYPLWLKYSNKIKAEVILCPRGSLYPTALSLKWFKKKPLLLLYKKLAIHHLIKFHATNEREKLAIDKFFPDTNIVIANNLPNTRQPSFTTLPKNSGTLNCIFIARIVPIKNLLFLLELLQKITAQVTLTVVGPQENISYWKDCKNKIMELPDNIIVNYLGPKNNSAVTSLLQQQHLFILPTVGENFGHAIFESFLAGRPVLISDQTPWLHLTDLKLGWDIPLNNPAAFIAAIEKAAAWDQYEFDKFAETAWQYGHNFINNPALIKPYHQLFS